MSGWLAPLEGRPSGEWLCDRWHPMLATVLVALALGALREGDIHGELVS